MKIKGLKDTITWYDNNAHKYAESAENAQPIDIINDFISRLPLSPKVLDAGCGSGRDSRLLENAGAVTTGVDISSGLLEEAEKRSENIKFIKGDITDLPFSNDSFDGLWSHASLVHLEKIEDTDKAISEFNRVLKSGGVLHIFTKEQTGDKKTDIVSDSLSNHDRFFRYYKPEELSNLVAKNGFSEIKIDIVSDLHGRKEVSWISLFAKKN